MNIVTGTSSIAPGQKIHFWTVISSDGKRITVRCRCGEVRIITAEAIQSGTQTSCGCTRSFAPKKQARQEAQQELRRRRIFDWRPGR